MPPPRLEVRPKPDRLARISKAFVPIIRGLPVTGHDLEVVAGHLVSVMLVAGLSLSFLNHVYRFISASRFQRRPAWPCVRQELRYIRGILPLLRVSIFGRVSS